MFFADKLIEKSDRQCISYTFNNNDDYYETGHRILAKEEEKGLIRANKVMHNGKVKLLYLIDKYRTIQAFSSVCTIPDCLTAVESLLNLLYEFRNDRFIHIESINIAMDKIFIDEKSKAHMIYVPINTEYTDQSLLEFEKKAKETIMKLIELCNGQSDPTLCGVYTRCTIKASSISDVKESIKARFPSIRLVNVAGHRSDIEVKKEDFIIGKNSEMADGVIDYSNAVSRKHCKITYIHGDNYVIDLESLNHTYINGVQLEPNVMNKLNIGDILKIADVEYIVRAY